MTSKLLAGACFGLMLAGLSVPSAAETPSAAKAAGTLKVDYEFTSSGSKITNNDQKQWNVKRTFNLTVAIAADAPIPYPTMQKLDASQQRVETQRQAAAQRATAGMGGLMAGAEQIMKLCGDNEACIERETMKMAGGINPSDYDGTRRDIQAASALPASNYQDWRTTGSTSTFSVTETMHQGIKDPICTGKPQLMCLVDTTGSGQGNVPLPRGGKDANNSGMIAAEFDLAKNTLTLALPLVSNAVSITQTVKSEYPPIKSGNSQVYRKAPTKMDMITVDCAGSCRNKSGQKTIDMTDELSGQPGKMLVKWQFTAK